MSAAALGALAREVGLALRWTDAHGRAKMVSPDTVRAVLSALALPADSPAQIAESRAMLRQQKTPLRIVRAGAKIRLSGSSRNVRFVFEGGEKEDAVREDGVVCAPKHYGYCRVEGQRVAVVPRRAWSVGDLAPRQKIWGIGAQVYALRGGTTRGFGDFAALAALAEQAGAAGADALAMSPVHALFGAAPDHYSPYSPSTRLFLNTLYVTLPKPVRHVAHAPLIDWPRAALEKQTALRAFHRHLQRDPNVQKMIAAFAKQSGERQLYHARFEVLDARFRIRGITNWRNWPAEFRSSRSKAVRSLSARDPEVAYQIFLQWLARKGLDEAQSRAHAAGMRVGLIADMAIGMDPAGSHAWQAPDEVLNGLSVGAPPDIFNAAGQDWGLTTLSPLGLLNSGFSGFIETLRAAMRSAGGIRLDHAMGLTRLWVVPQGASAADGVYLHYPFQSLLGLLALESQRHRAVVVAEDLGTVPQGFRSRIARAGIHGMRVLWFERGRNGAFARPEKWDPTAAALSTTHDLPTLAGWWKGHDIAWRAKLAPKTDMRAAKAEREKDRHSLWRAFRQAKVSRGAMPKKATKFVDSAFAFVARTPCPLALLPVEDFEGTIEQPNLPGTTDRHPNWRRRLTSEQPLGSGAAKRRVAILNKERAT